MSDSKSESLYPELMEQTDNNKRLLELEVLVMKYKKILEENELLEDVNKISDVESLCINELAKLKIISDNGILGLNEIKALDLLHTNLLRAKGQVSDKEKKKGPVKTPAELLSILDGYKKS